MPYKIVTNMIGFASHVDWWLDPDVAQLEARLFPWIQGAEKPVDNSLCCRCRCIDFSYFFARPRPKLVIDGTIYPSSTPRKISTLAQIREGFVSGCSMCTLLHVGTSHLLGTRDLPARLSVLNSSLKHQTWSTKSVTLSEVWCQLYPVTFRQIRAKHDISQDSHQALMQELVGARAKVTLSKILHPSELKPSLGPPRGNFFLCLLQHPHAQANFQTSDRMIDTENGTIDFGIVASWLRKCDATHIDHTSKDCPVAQRVGPSDHKTYFIDVERLQLVERSVNETDFAALSYVWGKIPFFHNNSGNCERLRRGNGVAAFFDKLPRVIKDAIVFCQRVGIRYLWADAICITQDTSQLKMQIRNMHSIFSNAFVTIIAASGTDAHSPLPGVSPFSRKRYQSTATVAPDFVVATNMLSANIADQSPWNSRGWTFQERLLSQRMIFFCADQVRLYCRHGIHLESQLVDIHEHPNRLACTNSRQLNHAVQARLNMDFEVYNKVVSAYSQRNLTYDTDILNAFTGLLPVLADNFSSKQFYSGLPVCLIDIALLWRPSGRLSRRRADGWKFPSWSWIGWKGSIEYPVADLLGDRTRAYIELYPQHRKGTETNEKFRIFPEEQVPASKWERHNNRSDAGPFYTIVDDPLKIRHCRPGVIKPSFQSLESHELHLKADVAIMKLGGELHGQDFRTKSQETSGNVTNPMMTFKILSKRRRHHAGYVIVDGNTAKRLSSGSKYRLVGISRAVEESGSRDSAWEESSSSYVWKPGQRAVNPRFVSRCKLGWSHVYDHDKYDCNRCWGLYNVIMIDKNNERLGVGQVHAHAFESSKEKRQHIVLR